MKRSSEDIKWSNTVRERDKWTCQRCGHFFPEGRRRGLDAAHIWSRRIKRTRHDLENGVSLCTGCHNSWAHANPLEFHDWLKQRMGEEQYTSLMVRAKRVEGK